MYTNFPSHADVQLQPSGELGSVRAILTIQVANVPQKCAKFIEKLGWKPQSNHPDTSEMLFHKPPPDNCSEEVTKNWNYELQFGYWHWYEAMAYEFGKFMGIDEDIGGAEGMASGSDGMVSPAPAGRMA